MIFKNVTSYRSISSSLRYRRKHAFFFLSALNWDKINSSRNKVFVCLRASILRWNLSSQAAAFAFIAKKVRLLLELEAINNFKTDKWLFDLKTLSFRLGDKPFYCCLELVVKTYIVQHCAMCNFVHTSIIWDGYDMAFYQIKQQLT